MLYAYKREEMKGVKERKYTLSTEWISSFIRVIEEYESSFSLSRGPIKSLSQTTAQSSFFQQINTLWDFNYYLLQFNLIGRANFIFRSNNGSNRSQG